jgi:quercetin dioxygenase-like cupin family protein
MHTSHTLRPSAIRPAATLVASIALAAVLSACQEPGQPQAPTAPERPRLTLGQGSTPTNIGQATYRDIDKVKRKTKDWQVELKAKGGLEVVVRSFAYAPGSFTGWHKHPGPVLIQVVEGEVAFYEADAPCTPVIVRAGEGYLDTGEHGHIGRNLGAVPAKDITIYLAPPGTQVSQLRIDMPEPPGAAACR